MNNSTIYVCRQCGRPYVVIPTGNLEEWYIFPYYPEETISLEAQEPTLQDAANYVLTGEYIPQYVPTRHMIKWIVAAREPFCPISECLGELEESFVITNN